MSVLKTRRTVSRAEFVQKASDIYDETLAFLTRLSARWSRLVAEPTAALAGEVEDWAVKANSYFPNTEAQIAARLDCLLKARAALMALDTRLSKCYRQMIKNPEGCFTTSSGAAVKGQDAETKLDKMAQSLGDLIDSENELLKGQIKSMRAKQLH